jgi:hypothetical protein
MSLFHNSAAGKEGGPAMTRIRAWLTAWRGRSEGSTQAASSAADAPRRSAPSQKSTARESKKHGCPAVW